MAEPFLRRKDNQKVLSNKCTSWSGWNVPWGQVVLTPLNGGAYLQKTSAGVLQCRASFAFATRYPNATIDNYFEMLACARAAPVNGQGFLFEYRDLEGFTRDVQIKSVPFGVDSIQDLMRFWHPLHSHYEVPVELIVPGYIV